MKELRKNDCDLEYIKKLKKELPKKEIHFAYNKEVIKEFKKILKD